LVVENVSPERLGVVNEGLVAKTKAPLPVSSVMADARLAEDAVARKVATPVPKPLIPVLTGKPVQLVRVPDVGVPRIGVTNVGEVAKTNAPLPVSSVTALIRFALEGVARKVATPVPNPETPVLIGNPVQLVRVPLVGVPSTGVTRVGEVERTLFPEPVLVVTPVPPLATAKVPDRVTTPVVAVLGVKPVVPALNEVTPPPPPPVVVAL
jgi:hypothetical protein